METCAAAKTNGPMAVDGSQRMPRWGGPSESNRDFLHGWPAAAPVARRRRRRMEDRGRRVARARSWRQECADCQVERQRRNRRLKAGSEPEAAARKLAEEKFKKCVLIAPFNKAVFQFSTHRA